MVNESKEEIKQVGNMTYDKKTGIVELHKEYPEHKFLWGKDFHPIPKQGRTWGYWAYVGNWSSLFNAAVWGVAGAGIALGLPIGFGLAVATISIVLLYFLIIVQSHAASRYGLAEPQLTRVRWGVYGAWFASLIRGIIALGWFGIQTYVFTEISVGIYLLLIGKVSAISAISALGPSAEFHYAPALFIGTFIIVFIAQAILMYVSKVAFSQRAVKYVFYVNIPLAISGFTLLFLELMSKVNWNWSLVWSTHVPIPSGLTLMVVAFIVMNAVLADLITVSMSMPDLVRFAKSQKVQILSQLTLILFYVIMNLYGFMGTAATILIFGHPIYDPILITLITPTPLALKILILMLLAYATYTVNIQANLVPPSYDLSNLWPGKLNFWKGAVIALIIALILQAWALWTSALGYLENWLGLYGTFLGPIVSVVFFDYLIIRRFKFDVEQIYLPKGEFRYWKGINPAAFIATAVAVFVVLYPGLPYHALISALSTYVAFFVTAAIYLPLMKWWIIPKYQPFLKGGLIHGYTNEKLEALFDP